MKNRNSEPLADRLEQCQEWIDKRKGKVLSAKEDRADELKALERLANKKAEAAYSLTTKAHLMGNNIDELVNKIRELELLLEEVRDDQARCWTMRDGLMVEHHHAQQQVIAVKKRWRVRLIKEFGDGKFRRRRRDLKKLQRRLERKEERAKSIPTMTAQEIQYGVLPMDKVAEKAAEKVDNQS